jgi:DNA-binding MarR family transcriptional regulator
VDYNAMSKKLCDDIIDVLRDLKRNRLHRNAQGEMFVLDFISKGKQIASPGEISTATGASTAHIAMALRGLERKGFIERAPDKDDRRRTIVTLTPAGKRHYAGNQARMEQSIEGLLRQLGDADAGELLRIIERVAGIIRARGFETDGGTSE